MNSSEALEKITLILGCDGTAGLMNFQLGQGTWDSFAHVEIVDAVETALNRELTETEFSQVETGDGVLALINGQNSSHR